MEVQQAFVLVCFFKEQRIKDMKAHFQLSKSIKRMTTLLDWSFLHGKYQQLELPMLAVMHKGFLFEVAGCSYVT